MTIFVAVLLTLLALVFITYPLFKQKWNVAAPDEDDKFRELHSRRDTAYSMLKELEFDYQSGILTEEDYHDLESRYKRKAISILKDTDDLEHGGRGGGDSEEPVRKVRPVKSSAVDAEVEEEVLKLRRARGNNVDREVEEDVIKLRQGGAKFCPQCGTKSQEDDRFCASCGTKLK